MSRTLFWLARFALDAFAYVLSVIAATAFIAEIFVATLGTGAHDPVQRFFDIFVVLPLTTVQIGRDAFVPALVVIVLAELRAVRDWLYYAVAGIFTGFLAAAVEGYARGPAPASFSAGSLALLGAAGAVAGIVFWLIAGRSAGIRSDPPISRESSES